MNNQRLLTTRAHHANDKITLSDDLMAELTEDMCFVELCHGVVLAYDPDQQGGGEMLLWLLLYNPVEGTYQLSQRLEVSCEHELRRLCVYAELAQDEETMPQTRERLEESLKLLSPGPETRQPGNSKSQLARISLLSTHRELYDEQPMEGVEHA
ncbi:MAG: hypothetical protein HY974_02325 [Candidatus Kerfeldbacteria bacterium]|nr:hypothetical protein [Candidatus Kerfeldbacteria bacterium]